MGPKVTWERVNVGKGLVAFEDETGKNEYYR